MLFSGVIVLMNYVLSGEVINIPVDKICEKMPKTGERLNDEEISALSKSIRLFGIRAPIHVKRTARGYEIIKGEEMLKAARMARLSRVPCRVAEPGRADAAAVLGFLKSGKPDFFEEAWLIKELIGKFGFSQAQVAAEMGKTQSAVSNKLRLLKLSEEAAEVIKKNRLSERHARTILRLPEEKQGKAAAYAAEKRLTVEQTERHIERRLAAERL